MIRLIASPNFVEISKSAKDLKPIFSSPPDEALIREIKDHITATGETWTWRGHTHTKPPAGSNVYYADTFEIPAASRKSKLWIPCPCCSPNHRKFGSGVIAYFPDEGMIRLIGPDCFASLNSDGHAEAMEGLRRRVKERQSLDYILTRIHMVPVWLAAAEEVAAIAKLADVFFAVLTNRIEVSLDVPLWRSVRQGNLPIEQDVIDLKFENGQMVEVTKKVSTPLFILYGHTALNPARRPKAGLLERALSDFRIFAAMTSDTVRAAPHMQRIAAVKQVRNFLGTVGRLRAELEEELQLLRAVNMQRLSQWASDDRSPVDFQIGRSGGRIELTGRKTYSLEIPEGLRDARLPSIGDIQ